METLEEIVKESKTIAVYVLSPREDRASHYVPVYMQEQGYRIIPVHPDHDGELLGEKVYPDLRSIPEPVDIVDIFLRAHLIGPVVDDAITIGAKAVWMQLGLVNEPAAEAAREAGLGVIMDKCLLVEHKRMRREGTV